MVQILHLSLIKFCTSIYPFGYAFRVALLVSSPLRKGHVRRPSARSCDDALPVDSALHGIGRNPAELAPQFFTDGSPVPVRIGVLSAPLGYPSLAVTHNTVTDALQISQNTISTD